MNYYDNDECIIDYTEMIANNENEIIIVADAVVAEDMPITEAQILATDYDGDEGAEFYCQFVNSMNYFESFLDDPEKLCLPDENGDIPYVEFIEMMDELRNYKWAKRTWGRMEARTAGIEPSERLTQLEKSEHPDYKDWLCSNCLQYYKGAKMLKLHQERNICQERNTTLFVKSNKKKMPSAKFYHTALVLDDLIARAILFRKNIEPELEEEEFDEEANNTKVWVVKTYMYDTKGKTIDYAGLWEDENGNKEFKTEEEGRKQFDYARDGQGYISCVLVEIDPDDADRESIIDEWEDNISEYDEFSEDESESEVEEEIDYIEPELERQKLLIEFWRLEKISPRAIYELSKKYDKLIDNYTTEEIRNIIQEIIAFNMEDAEKVDACCYNCGLVKRVLPQDPKGFYCEPACSGF